MDDWFTMLICDTPKIGDDLIYLHGNHIVVCKRLFIPVPVLLKT